MQHLRLQSDVFRRGGRDGILLGEPVSSVDRVVRVDCVQRYLRGRPEKQGMHIMTFGIVVLIKEPILNVRFRVKQISSFYFGVPNKLSKVTFIFGASTVKATFYVTFDELSMN